MIRALVLLPAAAGLLAQTPAGLTPEETRGRQIYERGASSSGGRIAAVIGSGEPISGAVLPCANCHGHEGQGRPEGGISPSNITWDVLTKPYAAPNPGGRTHSPYNERLLRRAFGMGIDPAGNQLNEAMPRYQMSLEDAKDLVAYIGKLGRTVDSGIGDSAIRIGVMLPAQGASDNSPSIRKILNDYFGRVNESGGIFNRHIEIVFGELPGDPHRKADALRRFLDREPVFAIAFADFSGAEREMSAVLRETGMPTISTIAPFPDTSAPLNPWVFYLDGGAAAEISALADFAGHLPGWRSAPLIVCSGDAVPGQTISELKQRLRDTGLGDASATDCARLPASGGPVFWLRTEPPPIGPSADAPYRLFFSGALSPDLSRIRGADTNAEAFVAVETGSAPSAAPDPDARLRTVWERTTTSAGVLAEALRRAGRGLTRASFVEALEGFDRVQTDLGVPLTFGPARRVGFLGVRVLKWDPVRGAWIAQ